MTKTLRISVSDELYFKLGELKNRFKAKDWASFMQVVADELERTKR